MLDGMAVKSAHAIGLMSTAAMVPYATVDRMTRPMIVAGAWPGRKNPGLHPENLGALTVGFAAPSPGDAMDAVKIGYDLTYEGAQKLPGKNKDDLPDTGLCTLEDAVFDRDGPAFPTLIGSLTAVIRELALMGRAEREARVARLMSGDWTVTICLAPAFATIAWYTLEGDVRTRHMMEWKRPQGNLMPDRKGRQGVQRLTWLPADLLLAAANICAESLTFQLSDLPDPSPLLSGERVQSFPSTSSKGLKTKEAARPWQAGGFQL